MKADTKKKKVKKLKSMALQECFIKQRRKYLKLCPDWLLQSEFPDGRGLVKSNYHTTLRKMT